MQTSGAAVVDVDGVAPCSVPAIDDVILGRYDEDDNNDGEAALSVVSTGGVANLRMHSTLESKPTLAAGDSTLCWTHNHPASANDGSSDTDDFVECVRLLIRMLQQPTLSPPEHANDVVPEHFAKLARNSPDLLMLLNVTKQMQHALRLSQDEAATALDDAAVATAEAASWKEQCEAANERIAALAMEQSAYTARNERLQAEKRVLKSAYKQLVSEQYATHTQQVESYVVHALTAHEQYLQKNRSRTTTETTVEVDEDGLSKIESDGTGVPATGTLESKETSTTQTTPIAATTTPAPRACSPAPSTALTQSKPVQAAPELAGATKEAPQRHVGGFGAVGALGFGKTFNLKKIEEHKKSTISVPITASAKVPATLPPVVTPPPPSYAPVRFELMLPSQSKSSDSSESAAATGTATTTLTAMGSKVKNFLLLNDSPVGVGNGAAVAHEAPSRRNIAPLLCLDSPLQDDSMTTTTPCSMPQNVSFGPEDSIASALESPLCLQGSEDDNEDTDSLTLPNSSSAWKLGETACNPTIFRSLSIPVVHEELQAAAPKSRKVLPIRPFKFV